MILASLLPARIASRAGLNEVLKQGSRSVSHKMGAREPLVIAQIAIAIVLVFSAVLFGRSLTALLLVSPGFEAEGTLTMHLAVTRAKYPADNQVADYYERIVESVKTVPGVIEAGIVNRLPLSGVTQNGGIEFEGIDGSFSADWRIATPGYFKAIGIPLKQGRWFSRTDNPAAPRVGIIDDAMARRVLRRAKSCGKALPPLCGRFEGAGRLGRDCGRCGTRSER